ncbi:MAG: ferritin [Ignavibacteria bacterium]|nr:ferritin [Ignavibacteria bacterium]MBK6878719.1 ferritin [Ignavibacteria bacterium]MBK9225562.1 ferritin [Ignavibacteria bacterium]
MLTQKLQDALNEQINREFFSEYLYLAMSAYFESIELEGFANYFNVQAQEEHFHAMKMFNFVHDKGGRVFLKALDQPKNEYGSAISVIEEALEHERHITDSINKLMDIAIKENDHSVISFLKWYVDEQVEEEATITRLVAKLKMINGEGLGLLTIDTELLARTFTVPVEAN